MPAMNTHIIGKVALLLGAAVFLSPTESRAQIEVGLLNYWPLDGTPADTADLVPNATGTTVNDGTVNGNVTFVDADTEGLGAGFGQVGNFPGGAGNNITILDPDEVTNDIDRSNADVSISLWFRLNNRDTNWQALIAHGEGTDYRVAIRGGNDPIQYAYAGGGAGSDIFSATTFGAAPAGDGLWHHLVATTEGSITNLYVDGVLEATGGTGPINENGQNLLCIGCNPTNGREWNGLIDDIGMWDRALTADEAKAIYDAGIAGNSLGSLFPLPGDDDADGLPNAWEERFGLNPNDATGINGATGDFDSDNVNNITEFDNGTFPNDNDTDDDNLTDDVETNNGENSYVSASNTGTDPLDPDSDGDGIIDGSEDNGGFFVSETQTGSDPTVADTDADTMPDGYEVDNSLDPTVDDGALDPDTDGLTSLAEFGLGTDPQVADTDMDGLDDGPEVNTHLTDPLVVDSDGDTLSDGDEVNVHMTNPNSTDSDGDLFTDDDEINEGTNPNDASSTPVVPELPEPLLYYPFNVENGTEVENLGSLATAGTLTGGATYGESLDASFGTAFVGNRGGANDGYVSTGFNGTELAFGANYTAMAWVKWDGTLGQIDHMVFGQDDGAGNNNQLHHGIRDDSPVNAHYGGWGNDIADAGTVVPETWTHLAWQYDGVDKVVFVDGVETARAAGNPLGSAALEVIIGAHGRDAGDTPGNSFNGTIDEVKVYGDILSAAQIRDAMIPGSGAGAAGLEVRSIALDGDTNLVTLTFTSRPGRSYSLLWSETMMDGPDFDEIDDGISADPDGNITTYSFPAPRPSGDPGGPPVPKAFFFIKENE